MIPLLTRIDNELASCTDPGRSAELWAERASYLARTGEFAEAHEILARLRRGFGDGRNARVSVSLMLAEGILAYFERMDPSARDRMRRAKLIADATRLEDLSQVCAMWLAHVEFNRADYSSMLTCLRPWAGNLEHLLDPAKARAALLLADAFMYCGEVGHARKWYELARQAAIAGGDQAMLAATIYNKAAMGLHRLRLAAAADNVDPEVLRFVELEIASANNYHAAVGHRDLRILIDACRARLLLLKGEFSSAKTILNQLVDSENLRLSLVSDQVLLRLEHCRCLQGAGDTVEFNQHFHALKLEDHKDLSLDDQYLFLTYYREILMNSDDVDQAAQISPTIWATEDRMKVELASLRDGLLDLLPSVP